MRTGLGLQLLLLAASGAFALLSWLGGGSARQEKRPSTMHGAPSEGPRTIISIESPASHPAEHSNQPLPPAASTALDLPKLPEAADARREYADAYVRKLDGLFEREVVDTSWANETEGQVVAFFQDLPGVRTHAARCRSTLCRVEVEFDSEEARRAFDTNLSSRAPFLNARWNERRVRDETGRVSGETIMLARVGHDLPPP